VAICEGTTRPTFPKLLSQSAAGVVVALFSVSATAEPAASPVEFNPAFLQGGSHVDVSRFSRGNPVLPGDYLVDVQINSKWVGRASVAFVAQPDSDIVEDRIVTATGSYSATAPVSPFPGSTLWKQLPRTSPSSTMIGLHC